MASRKRHIDDEQPESIEDHFNLILADNTHIESTHVSVTVDDLPEWFDEELFRKGQEYYKSNMLGVNTAHVIGLVAVFLIPSVSKIFMFTKQSATSCAAFKRYFETVLHIHNLAMHNVMDPRSKFYKSLNTIRWKHSTVTKRCININNPGITQRDMVLTQFGFIAYVLMIPEFVSLTDEIEQRQAYNHFWRVVGHLLGIPERLNICRRNEYETTLLCKKLRDEVYVKHMKEPNEDFMHLATVAIDGLSCVDPTFDMDALFAFFFEAHGSKYEKKMSLYSNLNRLYRRAVFYFLGMPIIGVFSRCFWNVYLRTAYWLFERYPIIAWMKYGKDNARINLFPHSGI